MSKDKDVLEINENESLAASESGPNYSGKRTGKGDRVLTADEDADRLLASNSAVDGRFPYLDLTRLICIWLVVMDHGGTLYGVWNVMYVQGWVLQYLYIIAGISFGMSKTPLLQYVGRLGMYFLVGVFCNFTAWVVKGMDWKGQMWDVVFQFWFVFGLMGFVCCLAPLKAYLMRVRDRAVPQDWEQVPRDELQHWYIAILQGLAAVGFGVVAIKVVWHLALVPLVQRSLTLPVVALGRYTGYGAEHWGLPSTNDEGAEFLEHFCTYLQVTAISVFIILIFPMVSNQTSLVGWLVLLNTYLHRVFCYRAQEARMINSFDVTMIGMTCYYLGLRHRKVVGTYLVRYWFLVLFACAMLWPPGAHGRFDENPPKALTHRVMDNAQEALLVVLFLTAIERMVDTNIFMVDIPKSTMWALNVYGFLLFLVHKAIHIMIPQPLNWFLLVALFLPVFLMRSRGDSMEEKASSSGDSKREKASSLEGNP